MGFFQAACQFLHTVAVSHGFGYLGAYHFARPFGDLPLGGRISDKPAARPLHADHFGGAFMRPLDGAAANVRNHTGGRFRHYAQQGGNRPVFRNTPDYRLDHIGQSRPIAKIQAVCNNPCRAAQFRRQIPGLPIDGRTLNQRRDLFGQAVNACQQISLNKRGRFVFAHRAFRLSQLFSPLVRRLFGLSAVLLIRFRLPLPR
nr:Uncharacterised protein [Neisseria gonorrhoeae]